MKHRGFNLFEISEIKDKSGRVFTIRGNSDIENAFFRSFIDMMLGNPAFSAPGPQFLTATTLNAPVREGGV